MSSKLKQIIQKVQCKLCQEIDLEKLTYVFCTDCENFYCISCFKERFKGAKKDEGQSAKDYLCPFCDKKIEKRSLVRIDFEQNSSK